MSRLEPQDSVLSPLARIGFGAAWAMEIELSVAGGTGLAISANTFPVCSDGARQATMDGTATAAARATGSRLSEDVAPARAGAPGGVRPGAGDDAAPPFPPTTGRAYPRTGPAGAAGPAVADMPANGRTSVIASGSTLLPAIEGRAGHPTPTSGQLPFQFPPLARSGGGQPRPRPVVVIRHVTSSARSCPQPARHSPSPRHTRSSATRPSAASKGSPVSATQSARPSQRDPVSPDSSAQISLRRPVSPAQSEDPISRLITVSLSRSALIRRPAVPHNRGRRSRRASEARHRQRASRVAPTDALLP